MFCHLIFYAQFSLQPLESGPSDGHSGGQNSQPTNTGGNQHARSDLSTDLDFNSNVHAFHDPNFNRHSDRYPDQAANLHADAAADQDKYTAAGDRYTDGNLYPHAAALLT
jgi:hypothetical protein